MKVITLSGPSSSGKTTILNELEKSNYDFFIYRSEIRAIAKEMGHSLDDIMKDAELNKALQLSFTDRLIDAIIKAKENEYKYFITDRGLADGMVYYFMHKYPVRDFGQLMLDRLVLIKYIDYIIIVPPFTDEPLKIDTDDLVKSDIWLKDQDIQTEALYNTSVFVNNIRQLRSGYKGAVIKKLESKDLRFRIEEIEVILGLRGCVSGACSGYVHQVM